MHGPTCSWPKIALFVLLTGGGLRTARGAAPEIIADPPAIHLHGPGEQFSLLIHGKTADNRLTDWTHQARYESLDPQVAAVSAAGVVRSVADGVTAIRVEAAGRTLRVPVTVEGSSRVRPFHFENDIIPVLTRFRCNSSGCHGKAEGQNGFKLSVFGFDPAADYAALTQESRGRRVFPAAPEHSLLLQKVSGRVAHGGGLRIPRGSAEYELLRGWIAAGVPFGDPASPRVVGIRVEPRERILDMGARQQLRVVARYSDGRERDVTHHARFQSNSDGLATVSETGLVAAGETPGAVAVMAAYMGAVDVFQAIIPRAERIDPYPEIPAHNFIDPLVFGKLRKLHILPSDLADDAEFLRRIYLDVIGTLPTAAEARRFLADHRRPDRRARLVDDLLRRPEFADYWALKWADLLRVDRQVLGPKHAYAYYRWIRASLAANKPLDQFARDLLTADGPLAEVSPAGFYQVVPKPGAAASTLAQVFLGIRLACAECHHHPFDRWSQTDYFGMQAFFTGVSLKNTPAGPLVVAGEGPPAKPPAPARWSLPTPAARRRPPALCRATAAACWRSG